RPLAKEAISSGRAAEAAAGARSWGLPLGNLPPSVVLLVCDSKHLSVLLGVSIGEDPRVALDVVALADPAELFLSAAIAPQISPGERTAALLELGTDQLDPEGLAELAEVDVERR